MRSVLPSFRRFVSATWLSVRRSSLNTTYSPSLYATNDKPAGRVMSVWKDTISLFFSKANVRSCSFDGVRENGWAVRFMTAASNVELWTSAAQLTGIEGSELLGLLPFISPSISLICEFSASSSEALTVKYSTAPLVLARLSPFDEYRENFTWLG